MAGSSWAAKGPGLPAPSIRLSAHPSTPSVSPACRAAGRALTPWEGGSARQTAGRGSPGAGGGSPAGGALSRAVQSAVPRLQGSALPGRSREVPRPGDGGAGYQRRVRGRRGAHGSGARPGARGEGLVLRATPAPVSS